jgi:type II secretory pathway predicted ATPase ExeA
MDRPEIESELRAFFGFHALPFTKNSSPDEPFLTDPFNEALERLSYLVERKGIGALIGSPGSGKSTLLHFFLRSFSRATHEICYVDHTRCAIVGLLRAISRGFGITPRYRKVDVLADLEERIVRLSREKRIQPILVIDEAHLLPAWALDEIRLLTNFEEDTRDDLTLLLCGHPPLETNLSLAINEALAQRVVLRIRLGNLDRAQVERYIGFRLEMAGRTAGLFLPEAIEAIAVASRGIPRVIDGLSELSILNAWKEKRLEIDTELVAAALEEYRP